MRYLFGILVLVVTPALAESVSDPFETNCDDSMHVAVTLLLGPPPCMRDEMEPFDRSTPPLIPILTTSTLADYGVLGKLGEWFVGNEARDDNGTTVGAQPGSVVRKRLSNERLRQR